MSPTPSVASQRVLGLFALLGAGGATATLVCDGAPRFFANWVVWFLFVLTIGLGSLFIVALEHLVGSTWSVPLRRVPERLAGLVVWIVPVALVALLSLPHLFPWTHPEAAANPMVAGKRIWLNVPFFTARLLMSLVLWIACYQVLCAGSFRQDETRDPAFTVRARRFAPVFMVVFAFTLTNLAFDWISSQEPVWYSDIIGVYLFAGTFLAGLAGTALGVTYLMRRGRLNGVRPDHIYNLGGLLFAFVVFWSYIAFAQYMLQWYANMPEEVFWYEKRLSGIWSQVVLGLALLHLVVPLLLLVSRRAKGNLDTLTRAAACVLAAHFLDLAWLVFPALGAGFRFSWQELSFALLFVSSGLLWVRRVMDQGPDMPIGDPQLGLALEFRL